MEKKPARLQRFDEATQQWVDATDKEAEEFFLNSRKLLTGELSVEFAPGVKEQMKALGLSSDEIIAALMGSKKD